jgi:flagellar hook assembly protein FlgD
VLIATITDFVDYQMASYIDNNVPDGMYAYWVTNVYFGLYESTRSNIVNVQITEVEDPIVPAIVTELTGNYPNPFNPSTSISYTVKTPSQVNITIYNLKGEKVRTLVNESKANGFYKTIWNGKDDSGKAVSSGVYLYRMQADNYVSTKRMMLMK